MVFSKDDKERWSHPGSPYPPTDEEYISELEAYLDEIHKPFGGIEASEAHFTRYLQAAKLLDQARPALRGKYPDKWVSMDENGALTVADTHEDLITTLAAKGLFSGHFPFAFLNTKPRRWTF